MTDQKEATKSKILIVEDEAIIAMDLKSRLEQMGYTVLAQVNSAEKALELAEQELPDLVLMDIVLKGKMDGIEAADIIHSRWRIPVVFCTAYADRDRLERAKLVYPFGYMLKPFKDNDIRVTVEMALYVSKADRERRKAEEALQQKDQELEKKNEELIRFTYAVSHDLKSPLVTIKTFLGYLEQDAQNQNAERMEQDLTYIHNAADKMSQLLDELLALSRIGRLVNPSVEIPLGAVAQEALDLVAGQITERGVEVKVTEEPIRIFGDRPRLVEVFQNLVTNAVKFMGDQPNPRVEIGVEQAGGDLVLFVRDNGIGIDPRFQPKLFGLFEKLDPRIEGAGIGLTLVKRIVEVHGGRIWLESEGLGRGTTFRFTLAGTRKK